MRVGMLGLVDPSLNMNKTIRSFLAKEILYLAPMLLVFAAVMQCASVVGHAAADPVVESPAAKRGDAIFHQRCVMCHNKKPDDTSPFGPPNLYQVVRHKVLTVPEIIKTVHQGKGPMPSFGTTITNAQIKDVIAYLGTH